MSKVNEVQEVLEGLTDHIDTAKDFVTLLTAIVQKVVETVPAEDVAKLISTTGGYLGTALKPIRCAFVKVQDDWMNKQVEFIKKSAGISKISEKAAVKLIAIRTLQFQHMSKNLPSRNNDSK